MVLCIFFFTKLRRRCNHCGKKRKLNAYHFALCIFNNAMHARLLSPPPLMRCIYTIKWFERSELAIIFIYGRATSSQKSPCTLYIQGVLKFLFFSLNYRFVDNINFFLKKNSTLYDYFIIFDIPHILAI